MTFFTFLVQLLIYSFLPLFGIFFFGWDWKEIIILFWLENITIGARATLGMIRTKVMPTDPYPENTNGSVSNHETLNKYGSIVQFIINYGGLTAAHGIFLFVVLSSNFFGENISSNDIFRLVIFWIIACTLQLIAAFNQPAPIAPLKQQSIEPFKRIAPLHLAIIFGVFAIELLNLPAGAVIILIGVKFMIDVMNYKSVKPVVI